MEIGLGDLNAAAKNLTASEGILAPTGETLTGIAGAGDISPPEAQLLRASVETLLNVRVRREHAILGRVYNHLLSRQDGDGALKPIDDAEARALIEITGTLSNAENDALKSLRDKGLIDKDTWSSAVEPFRSGSNDTQKDESFRIKVKYGAASFGNQMAPMGLMIGLGTVLGGPLGTAAGMALSMGMGLGVTPKIEGKIRGQAKIEGKTLGMNVLEGKETRSEAMFLTERAVDANLLLDDSRPMIDRLETEAELCNMLVKARKKAGSSGHPLEKPFVATAIKYQQGIVTLLDAAKSGSMDETQLKQGIYDLRSEILNPGFLDQIARQTIASQVSAETDGQALGFLRTMDQLGSQMLSQVKSNGGAPSEETTQTAGALLVLSNMLSEENSGLMNDSVKDLMAKLAGSQTLDHKDLAVFGSELSSIKNEVSTKADDLAIDSGDAKSQAKQALNVLWGQVVPSFQEGQGAPDLKNMDATKLDSGGYEVTGDFKSNWLYGSEGDFSIKMNDAGVIDADSMQVDVGEKYMKNAGESALGQYASMMGVDGEVGDVEIATDNENRGANDPYTVAGKIGGDWFEVQISPMGMVDWDSIKPRD